MTGILLYTDTGKRKAKKSKRNLLIKEEESERTMEIRVAGICVDVRKKKIKNMYLAVKPPDGQVVISAPISMPDEAIEKFVKERAEWILKQRKRFEGQWPKEERKYVSGEPLYVWGKKYVLDCRENGKRNSFMLCGDRAVLNMRWGSTAEQREHFIREQYRSMLKEAVEKLLPKWEAITGLYCDSWQTKYMKTRWGTCNTVKKRIWFNVALAEKPPECLEYVILHELTHIRIKNHGPEFKAAMEQYMPEWKEVKKRLNSFP